MKLAVGRSQHPRNHGTLEPHGFVVVFFLFIFYFYFYTNS